jgi:hypothetical protein
MLRLARTPAPRLACAVATIAVAAAGLGCASSKLVSQWHDAKAGGPPLRNVLVIAVKQDPVRQRIWEDTFARAIAARGAQVAQCHQLFPNALPDTAQVVAKVREIGYDGVIVVRTTSRATHTRVVPPTTAVEPVTRWDRFAQMYVTYYREVTTPGYVETERVVSSEVTVWRAGNGGRMVWSGLTETVDPRSPGEFSAEMAKLVVAELRKAGLL